MLLGKQRPRHHQRRPPPQTRFSGVAPKANLIDLRALNSNGIGTDSSVIQAIDRAIQLKAQHNIRVINLSLGRPVKESYTKDPLSQAVERAWRAGIAVVVAAGNRGRLETVTSKDGKVYKIDGYGTVGSPGNHPLAITVGAMRDMGTPTRADDLIASYSSKGPTGIDRIVKPDLVAPGNRLFSFNNNIAYFQMKVACEDLDGCRGAGFIEAYFPQNRTRVAVPAPASPNVGNYIELSGASMATPMVAGAAALLVQKFGPAITPDTIKAKLMKSAAKAFPTRSTTGPWTTQYDIFAVGAGYLDVAAALNNPDVALAGRFALSPAVTHNCSTARTSACVKLSNPADSLFSTATWSHQTVWGSSVLWGDSLLWGDSVLWGDNTTVQSLDILGRGDR